MVIVKKLRPDVTSGQSSEMNVYLNVIAHEIRNPLVSVQGYATLLQEKYGRTLPKEGLDYLDRIGSNLKRLDVLLADITRFARITIDEARFTKVPMADIVEAAVETHLFQLHQKKISLQIQSGLPELACDANCMVLVFSNLLGNAIKYSRESRHGLIEVGYLSDEIFHKFYVRDNGVGFRARDRKKVFQIFSRLRDKKDVGGSGLGLSIVKQIVEGHGGEVWVESRKNRGATFFFTLPQNSPRA